MKRRHLFLIAHTHETFALRAVGEQVWHAVEARPRTIVGYPPSLDAVADIRTPPRVGFFCGYHVVNDVQMIPSIPYCVGLIPSSWRMPPLFEWCSTSGHGADAPTSGAIRHAYHDALQNPCVIPVSACETFLRFACGINFTVSRCITPESTEYITDFGDKK